MFPESVHVKGREPDLEGPTSKAWRIDRDACLEEYRRKNPDKDMPADATIGAWVIFAPWANPAWSYYLLFMVHLRPMPGLGEAKIYLPGATHEIDLWALDPTKEPNLLRPSATILSPGNFAGQMILGSDFEAADVLAKAVKDVVRGYLNPDTDWRHQWIERFGDHMIRK